MPFTWVNTALGNIKTALAGTYHHVSAKHAQRYLASFAWRFNRRYQLDTLTERLAYACARTAPHPYRVIIVSQDHVEVGEARLGWTGFMPTGCSSCACSSSLTRAASRRGSP